MREEAPGNAHTGAINSLRGDVHGYAVQSRVINGDVNIHAIRSDRFDTSGGRPINSLFSLIVIFPASVDTTFSKVGSGLPHIPVRRKAPVGHHAYLFNPVVLAALGVIVVAGSLLWAIGLKLLRDYLPGWFFEAYNYFMMSSGVAVLVAAVVSIAVVRIRSRRRYG